MDAADRFGYRSCIYGLSPLVLGSTLDITLCREHPSFETAPVIDSDDLVAQCTVLADKGCHHAMTHSVFKVLIFLQPTSERMMGLPRIAASQAASSPRPRGSTTLRWPGTER